MSFTNPVTTVTGSGKTDAFDLRGCASDVCFILVGGTGGTVTPQYADREATAGAPFVDGDFVSDPTAISVSANAGPFQIPFGTAKFVRFAGSGVTGTVTILFARAKNDRGDVVDVGTYSPTPAQVTA